MHTVYTVCTNVHVAPAAFMFTGTFGLLLWENCPKIYSCVSFIRVRTCIHLFVQSFVSLILLPSLCPFVCMCLLTFSFNLWLSLLHPYSLPPSCPPYSLPLHSGTSITRGVSYTTQCSGRRWCMCLRSLYWSCLMLCSSAGMSAMDLWNLAMQWALLRYTRQYCILSMFSSPSSCWTHITQ